MLACKIIREEGAFNKAINSACKYYDVDKDDVIKYVRMRQSHGQKLSNEKSPRRYFYYAVQTWQKYEYEKYDIVRATSENNASSQVSKYYDDFYGFSDMYYIGEIKKFNTKKEAEDFLDSVEQRNN